MKVAPISSCVVSAIVQGLLLGRILRLISVRRLAVLGLISSTLAYALWGAASQSWMMFAFLVPYCLGGLCGPALQAVISGHVAQNEQGALQGALTGLMSFTTIVGPLIMNSTFAYFSSKSAPFFFPGMHFLIGALCMLLSVIIIYKVLSREKKEHPELRKVIEEGDGTPSPVQH